MRFPIPRKLYCVRKTVTILAICLLSVLTIASLEYFSLTVTLSSSPNAMRIPARASINRTVTVHSKAFHCNGCFKSNFPITLDQPDVCQTENSQTIDVIFIIVTSYGAALHRKNVRETWGSVTRNNTSNFRHVFLFGSTKNDKLQQNVRRESAQFRDVVVSGFHDSYKNLTLKTIMGLRWAVTRCRHARFFMKVDDDVWVNTFSLMTAIENNREDLQHGLGGNCKKDRPIHRLNRSKWYISRKQLPGLFYPPYCLGLAYVGGMGVAEAVVAKSKDVPFFHVEDVYVGMCLREAELGIVRMKGFIYQMVHPDVCMVKNLSIAVHGVGGNWMRYYWKRTCNMYQSTPKE